jgi:ligand-binding sensor domain-containing protein
MLGQNVNAMACDSNGFMWFWYRRRFIPVRWLSTESISGFTIKSGRFFRKQITGLLADDNNCLWIATGDGTYMYNQKKNKKKVLSIVPEMDTTRRYQHYYAGFLYMDAEGQIYMATGEHLYLYDAKYKYFRRFNPLQTKDPKAYSAIVKDKNQNLWIATLNEGVYLVNKEGTIVQFNKNTNPSHQLNSNTVVSIATDDSYLWLSTYYGISAISLDNSKKVTNFNSSDQKSGIGKEAITRLYADTQHNLWVCTESGLYLFNKEDGNFWLFRNEPDLESSLSSDNVKNYYGRPAG